MTLPSADQLAWAVYRLAEDRDRLLNMLARVSHSVLDQAPDGMTVAYLPVDLIEEIRDRLT